MLLEIDGLTKRFGGLTAVSGLDMFVNKGEITGLIGPNGAGKTTIFNLITGVLSPTKGRVTFDGKNITRKKPHVIAKLGIGRTFQLNPLFPYYTVLKNVTTAFHLQPHSSFFDIFFNTRAYRRNEAFIRKSALDILQFVGLELVREQPAMSLPHGYQKMLGVARALAIRPKLLLLDEPLGGMNPTEINYSLNAIKTMRDQGITILIVEHNMEILDLCDRVIVINFGQKIAEGLPEDVRENKGVIRAYFGGEYA